MQFNEDTSPSLIRIRGLRDKAIEIQLPRHLRDPEQAVTCWLEPSFIISPHAINRDWPELQLHQLQLQHLQAIAQMNPEVVLLGSGAQLEFPGAALSELLTRTFTGKGIGVEFMNNESACRTYNILMHEGRNVVAVFLR